ncbi:MAG: zinc carboxypeptidase, partial [Ferruginibacter sp.]
IGMTYEQAGHSMAGLAIANGADTLKLTDRIEHHFVTGMSTIEVASLNSSRLIKEFKKYFDDSYNSGNGIYKTYILRGDNESKINTLTELLKRNNIQYSKVGRSSQLKGFDYFSNTNTSFSTNENDLLISSFQPKSELVRVLFEPQTKLSDSATYDITAWSLPYAYGIQAYALKEKVAGVPYETVNKQYQMLPDSYGYLIEYNSFTGGKVLASLLKNNFNIRLSNNPFSIGGRDYKNGTLIILKASNKEKIEELSKIAYNLNAVVTPISSGFMEKGFDFGSDKIKLLKKPNVAMIISNTSEDTKVGEVWHLFDHQLNYPLTIINSEMNNIDYSKYDVIILPSGYYKSLSDKNENADLKSWINRGGRLIAMEYVVKQLADGEWGIKIKKDDEEDSSSTDVYADLKKYGDRERDGLEDFTPGSIFKLELDNTHPLAFGYPNYYYTLKQNTTMYSFLKGGLNVGVIKKNSKIAGFVGARLNKKLEDATIFGVQPYGRGSIIYMAEDPLFRSFWENGKLLFTNAVFLTGE